LDRIDNADLREALREIAQSNTFFYLDNDLGVSIEQMERAARQSDYTDKTLIWVSYPSGIDCYSEREVFQKDTRGYNGVMYHGNDMPGYLKRAYAVDVIGIKENKLHGSLYEIDIKDYAKDVHANAVSSNTIRIYEENGRQTIMPRDEFNRRYPLDLVKMAYWRHEPDDSSALKAVIENVWNKSRDGQYKLCSLWEHTNKLYDGRYVFYADQILRDISKLREPNSSDKQFFTTQLNSYIATAFNPDQFGKLLEALPYKNPEFSIKKGQRDMNVIVPRDEVLQLRKEPEKKSEKPSILDALKQGAEKSRQQDNPDKSTKKSKETEI